jgi:RNA polymerase sigma-70 factor, ECF subfamily
VAANIESRNEVEMIALVLGGQPHLFHDLIRPYERSVYAMALSFLHNEADAEDAAQEAFLKAYRNLASFRGDAKFSTWLITITLNEARGRLRRMKGRAMESIDEPPDEHGTSSPALMHDWREIPSEALERQEIRELLQTAVNSLPPIYREIVMLRDVEELNIAEAAEVLRVSTGTVKVRLHRARIMLQKTLAPHLKTMNAQSASQAKSKRRWFPWS